MTTPRVIVVGGGLAGLTCARTLADAGLTPTVLESADAVGGRVRTDVADGFRIDRGFQVLLEAYPLTQRWLDYAELDLQRFEPGALVWDGKAMREVMDPFRRPGRALAAIGRSPIPLRDVPAVTRLALGIRRRSLGRIWREPEKPAVDVIRAAGVSERTIDTFFRPFFGGVFFDRRLQTSRRFFEFVFKMFGAGAASVPRLGMEQIPRQLAAGLPAGSVRTNTPVRSITHSGVELASGERLKADAVVVATDARAAGELLGDAEARDRPWSGTATLAFAARTPPVDRPILVLDGAGVGPVNHLAVMTNVSRAYGPEGDGSRDGEGGGREAGGQALIYANTAGLPDAPDAGLESRARAQLARWFGESAVDGWRLLRIVRVEHALPNQDAPRLDGPTPSVRVDLPDSLGGGRAYRCGDHVDDASINGAMASGERAGRAVLRDLADGGVDVRAKPRGND
jgi:glycine/D-amino acid oxidase-like deaminating enzyme